MAKNHRCGPTHHKDFFNALFAVFAQYPEEGKIYTINCIDHEMDVLGIDFEKQVAVRKIEGQKIITEHMDREAFATRFPTVLPSGCCGSNGTGKCTAYWV
jgi:hypothetical protein